MANIVITLLNSKRTRAVIDAMDVTIASQPGGYVVVAGEDLSTTIKAIYPDMYAGGDCYVYMKNSRGEYATVQLGAGSEKEFALPASMTYAGNTQLTFYSVGDDNTKTVWVPVIVPVTATGVDYTEVARASYDVVQEAISKVKDIDEAEAIRVTNEGDRVIAETNRNISEASRVDNETTRVNEWSTLKPQMEQILANSQSAQEAYNGILAIYNEFQITFSYDEEGYPIYVDKE